MRNSGFQAIKESNLSSPPGRLDKLLSFIDRKLEFVKKTFPFAFHIVDRCKVKKQSLTCSLVLSPRQTMVGIFLCIV